MNKYLLMISLFLFSCGFASGTASKVLEPKAFLAAITSASNLQLVDVRTPGEFASGHIKNFINVDWHGANFDKEILKFDKSKTIYINCRSGRRSAAAAGRMSALGFKDVVDLAGGMNAWMSAKLPVVTD